MLPAVNTVLDTTVYQIFVQQQLLCFVSCPNNPLRLLSSDTRYHVNTHLTLQQMNIRTYS